MSNTTDSLLPPEPGRPPAPTVTSPPAPTAHFIDGPSSPAPAAESRGPAVPGYEIEGVLGRGGMGVVYKARQVKANRTVALKMILAGGHAGAADLERFRTEAEAIARLQHPNIVQIHEVGDQDGLPFFSLEFCPGGSLDRHLAGTPLPPREAAALVQTLARAMQAAHEKGVIHRDLKPHNVLLAENRTPKITDFGLAKKLDEAGHTASGAVMGTPSYMAPEQAAGKVDELGPACDVYALGAILYECLTGRPPFKAATQLDTLLQVMGAEPAAPRQLNPKVPADLEIICLKCLQKEPRQRFASAAALAEDLARFQRGEPIAARPVGRLERTWRWCRRNPALAGLALALVVGTAVATWLAVRAEGALASERQAQKERALARADALLAAGPEAVPTMLAGLQPLSEEVRTRLREVWDQPDRPESRARRLRAGLALLADTPGVKGQLFDWLLHTEEPREFLLLRDGLLPHGAEFKDRLWQVAEAPEGAARLRFRALVALAAYDSRDARWQRLGPRVVEEWLSANPLHVGLWTEALRPVGQAALLAPLSEACRGGSPERRHVAATILADYAADRPELLVKLLLDADPRQWGALFPKLIPHRATALPLLRSELERPTPPEGKVDDRDLQARRQAQAAVGLLQLGADAERFWPLLRHPPAVEWRAYVPQVAWLAPEPPSVASPPGPDRRSYLLHDLGRLGTPADLVLQRLEKEQDAGALQALVLSLGEYGPEQLPASKREPLVAKLLTWYREHPDAGVHGAIDWLLQHGKKGTEARPLDWGQAAALAKLDAELAGRPAGKKGWYVTGKEGHTLAVVRGPVEFLMGSPEHEPDRVERNEPQYRRRIGRSFAIATKEVTVTQFQRFLEANPQIEKQFHYLKRYSPDDDGPQVGVTWYEAAAYCNWLSKQEGLPEEEWVYGRDPIREGMRLPKDWLKRKGYRLPTEAEWEYACRAGTATSRYYGSGEGLLGEHAWHTKTSADRAWPVGQLRPNGLGLFDMLGNAGEWCQDRALLYSKRIGTKPIDDEQDMSNIDNRISRVLRGASFSNQATDLRCAYRVSDRPDFRSLTVGLRVARTYD